MWKNIAFGALGVVGIGILCVSITVLILLPDIIQEQVSQEIPIINGSDAYDRWRDPPVPLRMTFWFFDVKNSEKVISGEEIPWVIEKGPYVYEEFRSKNSIEFSSDGKIVSYNESKIFYFNQKLSGTNLTENDEVTVINLPLVVSHNEKSRSPFTLIPM